MTTESIRSVFDPFSTKGSLNSHCIVNYWDRTSPMEDILVGVFGSCMKAIQAIRAHDDYKFTSSQLEDVRAKALTVMSFLFLNSEQ